MTRFPRASKGITGLETAIILTAFVLLASVFVYTLVSWWSWSREGDGESPQPTPTAEVVIRGADAVFFTPLAMPEVTK